MAAATLTAKGQIVIPAEIRSRYELTPGTQVEFIDEGGAIRLVVRRKIAQTDPLSGFGLVKLKSSGVKRKLSDFDAAAIIKRKR
jgi:AbrB family looped-hinge helix DNA binding protein